MGFDFWVGRRGFGAGGAADDFWGLVEVLVVVGVVWGCFCCWRNWVSFCGGMGAKGRISSLPNDPIPTPDPRHPHPSPPLEGRERVPRSGMCIAGNHLKDLDRRCARTTTRPPPPDPRLASLPNRRAPDKTTTMLAIPQPSL